MSFFYPQLATSKSWILIGDKIQTCRPNGDIRASSLLRSMWDKWPGKDWTQPQRVVRGEDILGFVVSTHFFLSNMQRVDRAAGTTSRPLTSALARTSIHFHSILVTASPTETKKERKRILWFPSSYMLKFVKKPCPFNKKELLAIYLVNLIHFAKCIGLLHLYTMNILLMKFTNHT